jgi:hypothetical protein
LALNAGAVIALLPVTKLKGEKLTLAHGGIPAKRVIEFDFGADYHPRDHSGRLSQGDILIGATPPA